LRLVKKDLIAMTGQIQGDVAPMPTVVPAAKTSVFDILRRISISIL
jgi:hypothetical protein